MRSRDALALLCLIAAGCGDDDRGGDGGGGRDGGRQPGDGGIARDCAEDARYVYVVAEDRSLLRFEPDTQRFITIGTLACPADALATPFSMAVDRDATAWVLYTSGELFRVSTADASCNPTTFARHQAGFELFGMGFASNAEGSSDETLFVAGGAQALISAGSAGLATIDMATLTLSPLGRTIPGWPELSGTGNAELWGFFPQGEWTVRQIDKTTGATPVTFPLPGVASGDVTAWAFAFWGGRFYVFAQTSAEPSSDVYRLDPTDGSVTRLIDSSGYRIVGAGVSTCAPVDLI